MDDVTGLRDDVLVARVDGIVTITLDRPAKRNALTMAMRARLDATLEAAARDPSVRVVVLTGSGPAFCAGVDLTEGPAVATTDQVADVPRPVTAGLDACWLPVIAAINGPAMGGGLELALACDIRIAANGARFGLPEVRIGSLAGSGGISRLSRAVPAGLAARMVLTGDPIDSEEARASGLVSDVVPVDELATYAATLAARIAANAPLSVRAAKESLRAAHELPISAGLAQDRLLWAQLSTSADRAEGRQAFRDGRPPRFTGR
jgi:enoyl-CoA hydratase/carnithine racemase